MTNLLTVLDTNLARWKRARNGAPYTIWVQLDPVSQSFEVPCDNRAHAEQLATNLAARPSLDVVAVSVRRVDDCGRTTFVSLHQSKIDGGLV